LKKQVDLPDSPLGSKCKIGEQPIQRIATDVIAKRSVCCLRRLHFYPHLAVSPEPKIISERRCPDAFDSGFQAAPGDGIAEQRHLRQADRFASGKAIRRNHMELPLSRVAVIGARIHDRVMREDIDMGEASRVSDPIRTLEVIRFAF
jgi:hypothetical protein